MNEAIEELLAEQAAQSVAITTLLRAVMKMAGAENGGDVRRALLAKWDEEGSGYLDKTKLVGLTLEQQARVIEKAKARLTDILTTAHS